MSFLNSLGRLALLAALGYLGFYVYGLVLGTFSPFELVGFTILAVVCLAAFVIHIIRLRRALATTGGHEAMMRKAHVYRERRGF
jgi:hypothetical protein